MNKNPFSIIFLLALFLGSSLNLHAQEINYQAFKKPLEEILKDISGKYQLYFSYSPELLDTYKASIYAENQAIETFLQELLNPFGLQAKRSKGNYFYLQKAKRKLSIRIKDKNSGEALAYAIVRSLNSRRGAYADENGIARMEYDTREDSLLQVNHIGYLKEYIRIKEQMPESLTMQLEADSVGLEEVLIEYNNEAITLSEGAQFILNPGNMKVLPGLAEADVLLSVQSLPGIESNDETASGINIRGGGSDELMVYWDRIPIYKQAHFFGTLTTFIPSTVDKISAFKNYIPAQYTGATSGLLEISLPDSVPYRPQAVVNANFTHTDLMLEVPIKEKLAFILAGRLSFHDSDLFNSPTFTSHRDKLFSGSRQEDILREFVDEDDEETILVLRDQTSLSYRDLNGKLIFKPTNKDYFSLSFMQNSDRFNFNASSNESSVLAERSHEIEFRGVNFFHNRKWNTRWQSQISISQANYSLNNEDLGIFEEGTERNKLTIINTLDNTEAKISLDFQASQKGKLSAGYQFNSYSNFFKLNETSTFEEPVNDSLEAAEVAQGIFLKYHYSWEDRIDFQPQVRVDQIPGLNETLLNPVITFHYKVSPDIWFKSSYGQYIQLIRSLRQGELDVSNVSESVWLLAEGSSTAGDEEELPIIKSRQFSVGGLFKKKGWLIDLDFYWKQTEALSSINQFNRNSSMDIGFALGSAESVGLDFMLKKKFGRYQTWMSYSLSKVTNSFEDLSDTTFPSSFDRPHQIRWVHNLYLAPFEFSIGWILKSGTPYTEPAGLTFFPGDPNEPNDPDNPNDLNGYYEIRYGSINGARLPLYHRLDLSAWHKFEKRMGGFSSQIGFSIQNVYNRNNIWQRFYFLEDIDDDQLPEITKEERSFLGFTPNLSVRLNF
ncbi:MAG: hypothetical protein AAF696_05975 [Bacteroidota bacterium]